VKQAIQGAAAQHCGVTCGLLSKPSQNACKLPSPMPSDVADACRQYHTAAWTGMMKTSRLCSHHDASLRGWQLGAQQPDPFITLQAIQQQRKLFTRGPLHFHSHSIQTWLTSTLLQGLKLHKEFHTMIITAHTVARQECDIQPIQS